MKKISYLLLALAMVSLSGCAAIARIFKAGVAVGVIAVVVIVGLIIWIIAKVAGK